VDYSSLISPGLLLDTAVTLVRIMWPVIGLLLLIATVKAALRLRESRRLERSGIGDIDTMDGRTFEKWLQVLFQRLGYAVELTRSCGDQGADLVVRKQGIKTVVQAKRWKRGVGNKAVQEVVASKALYGCTGAMVVTNSYFSKPAKELATANKVELWDRDRLVQALLDTRVDVVAEPAPAVPVSVPATETAVSIRCATCDRVVPDAVRDYCLARPGRFGGHVYCYAHQRSKHV
jgi:restriction system protein